jgi:two-component system, LuxR family, sensor kinase FixL
MSASSSQFNAEWQAFDLAPVAIRDLDGKIRLWTTGMQHLYGYSAAEAVGRVSHELLKTAFPQPLRDIETEMLDQGTWSGELVHRRRDNGIVVVASLWSLFRAADGTPHAVTEVNSDLTKQKSAEAERLRLASIIESSEDAIIGKNLEGLVTSWNKAAEALFGFTAEEILGRPVAILFPLERVADEQLILERLRRGERVEHYDAVRLRKDGTEVHVSLSISPIRDLAGEIVGASKIARDITDQRRTQERLQETQAELRHVSRLSTMGKMASSLAHELNQPLTATRNYLAALRRLTAAPELDRERIGEIAARAEAQAARAGEVIRNLREFVGKGETNQRPEDLKRVVEEATALALIEAKHKGVTMVMQFDRSLPPVTIDRIQIQQVVVNLVRNAAEAMEGAEPRQLTVSTAWLTAAAAVEIAVADTGPGIAPEVAARLFQPFVTSKKSGMGLGLSICREIVEAHGGTLSARPNVPRGTVFTITLPVSVRDEGNGA